MKNNYAIRLNDPYRTEIECRLCNGEKPYVNGHEPHILAGDTLSSGCRQWNRDNGDRIK